MSDVVSKVSNMDIAGLCNRITKYAEEIKGSATAHIGGAVHQADLGRWASWMNRLQDYVEYHSRDELDLPKTFNNAASVLDKFPSAEEIENTENHIAKDILRYLHSFWIEASQSQSADWSASIRGFDAARFIVLIDSIRGIMELSKIDVDLPLNKNNIPTPISPPVAAAAQAPARPGSRF